MTNIKDQLNSKDNLANDFLITELTTNESESIRAGCNHKHKANGTTIFKKCSGEEIVAIIKATKPG